MPDTDSSADEILGQEFLTWLWYQSDTAPGSFSDLAGQSYSVSLEQKIAVQGGAGDAREVATVSGALSPLLEAKYGLEKGKKVSSAMIRLEKGETVFQFTLKAHDFSLGSFKTPKIDIEDKEDDPDALVLEKLYLIETCLNLLDKLYAVFIELRLSDKWSDEVRDIRMWLGKAE